MKLRPIHIILLTIPVLLTACQKIFEPYDERTYHDVIGVGYVFYYDTKEPAENVSVSVMSSFRSNGLATVRPKSEYFSTDSSGYFRIRFLKRTQRENVIYYSICSSNSCYKPPSGGLYLRVEEVQNAKYTIQIDTLWVGR